MFKRAAECRPIERFWACLLPVSEFPVIPQVLNLLPGFQHISRVQKHSPRQRSVAFNKFIVNFFVFLKGAGHRL
jgi:hypothetical protein